MYTGPLHHFIGLIDIFVNARSSTVLNYFIFCFYCALFSAVVGFVRTPRCRPTVLQNYKTSTIAIYTAGLYRPI